MKKVPVVFCIDVEPEPRELPLNAPESWSGFERIVQDFDVLRARMEHATGSTCRFSWFVRMDPQIAKSYGSAGWAAQRYGDVFERLRSAGDEVGLHVHAFRWDEKKSRWIVDHGDPDWIEHCIRTGFQAFEDAFRRQCRSFRFGDRWMSDSALGLVEQLGALFDLTVEMGAPPVPAGNMEEAFTGCLPSYRDVPRRPYRASNRDFRRRGLVRPKNIWMIPVSGARSERQGLSRRVRAGRALLGLRESTTLNLAYSGRLFRMIADRALRARDLTHLCVVVRTDAAVREEQRHNFQENLAFLISRLETARYTFCTPAEAVELAG